MTGDVRKVLLLSAEETTWRPRRSTRGGVHVDFHRLELFFLIILTTPECTNNMIVLSLFVFPVKVVLF